MARIAESEIERLKRDVAVERLAEARGVKLRRHGADLIGLCPFHDDREPSLVISPAKNLWHCLGACQAGGSPIDWVMRAEGVSFRHAVELLRGDAPSFAAHVADGPSGPPPKKSTVVKLPTLLSRDADDEALMKQVTAYYHATLKESPEALQYLASRGLESAELVEAFKLGFANRTLGYRLPAKNRDEGALMRGRLTKLGLVRESGHEHFTGSLVVPIFDTDGRVVEMYGRKITPGLRKGTPLHLYLPGPHRGVWNEAALATREVVLCEALIDAMTFWCAGIRNVTAAYGVEGFTRDHWEAFRKHGVKKVWIAFDRDEAGERAAEKLGEELNDAGVETWRVLFPKGMDANEYARKVTPAERSLELALRQAMWMGKGKRSVAVVPETIVHAIDRDELDADASVSAEHAHREESAPVSANASDANDEDASTQIAMKDDEESAGAKKNEETRANHPSLAALSSSSPSCAAPASSRGVDVDEEPKHVHHAPIGSSRVEPAMEQGEVVFRFGGRRWRVRGLDKNLSAEQLRVNVLLHREDGVFFIDTLEMYSARQRANFLRQASEELGVEESVIKREMGEVLLKLEAMQEEALKNALAPKHAKKALSEEERSAALSLLRDRKLVERIVRDFDRCGVVGEETNKLLAYLAATSRKLEAPLAVVIQSSSAAGKSSLMDAVLRFIPDEERAQYSAMTGQSLFYMGEEDLRHKILAIAEEEGAERASYALKLLQSEGELTIASTGKDPQTGRLVTQAYRVEGPVMIFLTTTAIEVDEELLNRCVVLTVDEGREQTRAIHARQRRAQTLAGLLEREERSAIEKVHQDAQRLLRPLFVVNPYAEELSFVDTQTRTRRDHMKYLTLIRAVTLLHQYQREVKTVEHRGRRVSYVEATRDDIRLATELAHEVLGRSLDELPPVTRRLLHLVEAMVNERGAREGLRREDVRFTRRELREATAWGNTQLKVHLARLEELEYIAAHRSGRGAGNAYELRYAGEGKDGRRFVLGLGYDGERSGVEHEKSGLGRAEVGPESGAGRSAVASTSHRENKDDVHAASRTRSNTRRRAVRVVDPSYESVLSFAADEDETRESAIAAEGA